VSDVKQHHAASFEEWIEHAFSHEVRLHGNAWFFDIDAPWIDPPRGQAIAYMTRLLRNPEEVLATFSDAQIAQGLTYLVSTSAAGERGWFYDRTIPARARIDFLMSNVDLFEKLFAVRCEAKLGHLSEESDQPLNMRCYMWWDDFPCVALGDDPDRDVIGQACVEAMRRILALDSIACQESALHGLGHAARSFPRDVEAAIDSYLAKGAIRRPELAAYARAARAGCVL
jgi:hypothetical protein